MEEQHDQSIKEQKRLGFSMVMGMWILILLLLAYFFNTVFEKIQNPNQSVDSFVSAEGVKEVKLQRNRYGHYVASGTVNGHEVKFMLDTGASDIAIPGDLARKMGLEFGPERIYQTANGLAKVYSTRLQSVSLGDISLQDVRASITPNMHGNEILLGMTFLKHLEFTQRGDQLTIRQYPSLN